SSARLSLKSDDAATVTLTAPPRAMSWVADPESLGALAQRVHRPDQFVPWSQRGTRRRAGPPPRPAARTAGYRRSRIHSAAWPGWPIAGRPRSGPALKSCAGGPVAG